MTPLLGWLTLVASLGGLGMAFFYAPADAVQGQVARIMYVHLPAIWMAMFVAFPVVLMASVIYLWKREPWWDMLAYSSAEIGVLLTALGIIDGSIWGKPTWGVWWTWDARLTTTVVLLLIFVGYLLLRLYLEDQGQKAAYCAVVGIIGVLDIPIIYKSVEWWRTLHQPSSFRRPGGPAIAYPMRLTLMINVLAFLLFYLYLLRQRLKLEQARNSREDQR